MKNVRNFVFISIVSVSILSACGNNSINNDLAGQVKRVGSATPLVCGDYTYADVSTGIMRNGVGSMSSEDVLVQLENPADAELLKKAQLEGKLVHIIYDKRRIAICGQYRRATKVELLK